MGVSQVVVDSLSLSTAAITRGMNVSPTDHSLGTDKTVSQPTLHAIPRYLDSLQLQVYIPRGGGGGGEGERV